MAVAAAAVAGVLGEGLAQDEGTKGAGPRLKTEAVLQRSVLQGCPCRLHPPAVLLSSAWTKLSTATLLASNRLWPSLAVAKGV